VCIYITLCSISTPFQAYQRVTIGNSQSLLSLIKKLFTMTMQDSPTLKRIITKSRLSRCMLTSSAWSTTTQERSSTTCRLLLLLWTKRYFLIFFVACFLTGISSSGQLFAPASVLKAFMWLSAVELKTLAVPNSFFREGREVCASHSGSRASAPGIKTGSICCLWPW